MELKLINIDKKAEAKSVKLDNKVFKCEFNEALAHQLVTAYLAGGRAGTKAQKTRSEVRGGGAKPHRQKGTGRARAGTSRSPIWRSGGVTFAAKPRDYTQKLNKKMYRAGMRSILSELVRQKRLHVIEDFAIAAPKTKELVKHLEALGINEALIITDKVDANLYLAARNLAKVDVCDVVGMNPVSLISFNNVIMAAPVVKQIEEMLG